MHLNDGWSCVASDSGQLSLAIPLGRLTEYHTSNGMHSLDVCGLTAAEG